MDNLQILLNKEKSKESVNINNSLTINFVGSEKLLPCDPMVTSLSEIDVYNNERENCNKIRLTVNVNPICSNVLFNNITEIVRNEGTDKVECLNYGKNYGKLELTDDDEVFCKEKNAFTYDDKLNSVYLRQVNAIRDTQLTSEKINFKYHCGIDIFNNHLLRSKTFKTICPSDKLTELKDSNRNIEYYFNTLEDDMRTYNGTQVKGYSDKGVAVERPDVDLHLYLADEIVNYKETVSEKLKEENGWFGFTNIGKLNVYDDEGKKNYDWFKVINNRKSCDFIDMYPERDLFYFDPKYNNVRQRLEKNWHYFLTYPSYSTTEGITFIKTHENGSTSLKVALFDDTGKADNGINAIKIWSVSKHGLSKDNIINIYKGDEIAYANAKVMKVEDEYTFYVFRNGIKISHEWAIIYPNSEEAEIFDKNGGVKRTFKVSKNRKTLTEGGKTYYSLNGEKCNVDDTAQDVSFTRVVENNEVNYYVRIFSKLPNWKFSPKKITDKLIYKEHKKYIETYQTVENEFDSTIGKLAFAKNIYNDNVSEIVFTDDIDIGVLKDNLGRPLTDIYFTIIKNNAGYREWYGKGGEDIKIDNSIVEYSHCFGKLNCAFKLSDASIAMKDYNNLSLINNVETTFDRNGLYVVDINGNRPFVDNDEIQYMPYSNYHGDFHYFGDLCCYSKVMCDEQIIQDIGYRFNTAQREVNSTYKAYEFFNDIIYDEIESDDYDDVGFNTKQYTLNEAANRKEGYYYKPHYRIRIKSYDNNITEVFPSYLTPKNIDTTTFCDNKPCTKLYTMENHGLSNGDKMYIYDMETTMLYTCTVLSVSNRRNVLLTLFDEEGNEVNLPDYGNKRRYKYFRIIDDLPPYAFFVKDGSCRYVYRKVIQNGFDDNTDIETYPFTNGALYVNRNINLFLRRQNPNGEYDIRSMKYPYDITTNNISYTKENKYYQEEDIEC